MKRKAPSGSKKKPGSKRPAKPSPKDIAASPTSMLTEHAKGRLVLADGTEVVGESFGAQRGVKGEVVFNTGMVGYPEALTDPSYRGQILVLTFPLVGNYGVPDTDVMDELGLPKFFESGEIHIAGLIVAEYSQRHSHWNAMQSLGEWLIQHDVPALSGVDTRMLAKRIRTRGALLGNIEFTPRAPMQQPVFEDPNERNLVAEVTCKEIRRYNEGKSPTVVAFDCGMKNNIIRYLCTMGFQLIVVPFDYNLKDSDLEYDGIFISNGPGDPTHCAKVERACPAAVRTKKVMCEMVPGGIST